MFTTHLPAWLHNICVDCLQKDDEKSNFNFESSAAIENDESEDEDWASESEPRELYPGHIPTTSFQKGLLSVASALVTITSPHRGGKCMVWYMVGVSAWWG